MIAIALLVQDADKLTLVQELTVIITYAIAEILMWPPKHWLKDVKMSYYQTPPI